MQVKKLEGKSMRKDQRIAELAVGSKRKDRQIAEWIGESRNKDHQIAELESDLRKAGWNYSRAAEHILVLKERLKQTEELSAARSAELSGTHAFLSTTDRLSEEEVLGVVRDLNENIFQVAALLTDQWGMLESSQATGCMDADPTSRHHPSVLTQLVRDRDPESLTIMLQSRLCSQVASVSSWGGHQELKSVYQRLSASGEHRFVEVR